MDKGQKTKGEWRKMAKSLNIIKVWCCIIGTYTFLLLFVNVKKNLGGSLLSTGLKTFNS